MSGRVKQQATSSSYDKFKFVSEIAQRHYDAICQKPRRIICEVQFKPSYDESEIKNQLEVLGWESLAVQEGKANATLIREFYANITDQRGDGRIKLWGKTVKYSPQDINEFYGLPNMIQDDYHTVLEEGPDYEEILRQISPPIMRKLFI